MSQKNRRYTVNYKISFSGCAGTFDAKSDGGKANAQDNHKMAWEQVKKDLLKLDFDEVSYEAHCEKCNEVVSLSEDNSEARFGCDCTFENR